MHKVFISAAEAASSLPRGRTVHTFIRIFGWRGAGFLAVKINGMLNYIETNMQRLAEMGLLPPSRRSRWRCR
jgi:hypothetical protein